MSRRLHEDIPVPPDGAERPHGRVAQQQLRRRALDAGLEPAAQAPGSAGLVCAARAETLRKLQGRFQRDVLLLQPFGKLSQLERGNFRKILRRKLPEGGDTVDPAQKFRAKCLPQDGLRADIGAVRREAEAGLAGLRAGQVS